MPAQKYLSMRSVVIQAYVWLALPALIFLAAWVRPSISIPSIVLLILALFKLFRAKADSPAFVSDRFAKTLRLDSTMLWICLVVGFLVIYCGIGGLFCQDWSDAVFRNAILYDLTKCNWPVEYAPLADGEPRIMSYYMGYWLPSAAVAKLFGGSIRVAEACLVLYSWWGMMLGICFIFSLIHGRRRWLALAVIFFFAAWDIIPSLIYRSDYEGFWGFVGNNNDVSIRHYAIFNLPVALINIYNQGITAFLGMLLLYYQRDNMPTFFLTFSLLLFLSPLVCLGAFPVCAVWGIMRFRRSLSWQNFLGIFLCLVFSAYFLANNRGSMRGYYSDPDSMAAVLLYGLQWFIFGVLVFLPFIWNRVKCNWVFWTLVATAFFMPLFSLNGSDDVGWRAAVPLSIYLMTVLTLSAVNVRDWKTPRNLCFAAVLAVAALAPLCAYVSRGYLNVTKCWIGGESPRREGLNGHLSDPDFKYYNNFVSSRRGFFYKYLMRHPEPASNPEPASPTPEPEKK